MMSPEEYTRYNRLKMARWWGKELPKEQWELERMRQMGWVRNHLQQFESICDYGGGSNWLKRLLRDKNPGLEYYAVDEIQKTASWEDLPSVDCVVSITVLEHQRPLEVMEFIERAKSKAKHLFIVTNNPECLFSHFVLWDDITHQRLYSIDSIAALLELKGYEILKRGYQDPVVSGSKWKRWLWNLYTKCHPFRVMRLNSEFNHWFLLAGQP